MKKLDLLRSDKKDEEEAIKTYGKRKVQLPFLSKMYGEMQRDEKDHKKKLESKMPGKIHSGKQFRFLEGIAHGMKSRKKGKKGAGPSKEVAEEMLSHETHEKKSKLAKDRD